MSNDLTLQEKLLQSEDMAEINEIVDLFNIDLQKKNILRSMKLSQAQDNVVDQIDKRLSERGDNFSNDDLIKYLKIINETLNKTDTTMENVAPTIQINQQLNVDNMEFNAESRKKILSVVNDILNGNIEDVDEIKEFITPEVTDASTT